VVLEEGDAVKARGRKERAFECMDWGLQPRDCVLELG
jgi:hypothetical protein